MLNALKTIMEIDAPLPQARKAAENVQIFRENYRSFEMSVVYLSEKCYALLLNFIDFWSKEFLYVYARYTKDFLGEKMIF